jgi:hypothetical protein
MQEAFLMTTPKLEIDSIKLSAKIKEALKLKMNDEL